MTTFVCSKKLGGGYGLSVVFQPCGTWWLQSSACSSWYFQLLLIHSPFPCSPSRVCAAKLCELAAFLAVRASQMRDALAPRRGEGRLRPGSPAKGPRRLRRQPGRALRSLATSARSVHQLWPICYGLGLWSQLSAI